MDNPSLPEKYPTIDTLDLWSCGAFCKDIREREVIGVYHGDRPLLVDRPWLSLAHASVIAHRVPTLHPLLSALIRVADYYVDNDIWYGEVAAYDSVLAVASGESLRSIERKLPELADAGYIDYDPGKGNARPGLIRIYPFARTGERLLQIEPSWLPNFICRVEPKAQIGRAQVEENSVNVEVVQTQAPELAIAETVRQAPVRLSPPPLVPTEQESLQDWLPGNRKIIEDLLEKEVCEDEVRPALGLGPRHGPAGSIAPDATLPPDWRPTWKVGSKTVMIAVADPTVEGRQIGVLPSWRLGGHYLYLSDSQNPIASKLGWI